MPFSAIGKLLFLLDIARPGAVPLGASRPDRCGSAGMRLVHAGATEGGCARDGDHVESGPCIAMGEAMGSNVAVI